MINNLEISSTFDKSTLPKRNILSIKNVTKSYNGISKTFNALLNVNLDIEEEDFVIISGKSGSGKSTLLNIIAGIDRVTRGEIVVDNIPIHNLNENNLTKWRGKNIGIVFQFFQLLPTLTCLENILLAMDFVNTIPLNKRKEKSMDLLQLVGMESHSHKLPSNLSGGEQQRVAIARALANDPSIIVADEPTGNLDSQTGEKIFNLFLELNKRGKTIIMVTHEKDFMGKGTKSVFIKDGIIE